MTNFTTTFTIYKWMVDVSGNRNGNRQSGPENALKHFSTSWWYSGEGVWNKCAILNCRIYWVYIVV